MIENGKRLPSEDVVEIIATVFQKESSWFLDENLDMGIQDNDDNNYYCHKTIIIIVYSSYCLIINLLIDDDYYCYYVVHYYHIIICSGLGPRACSCIEVTIINEIQK